MAAEYKKYATEKDKADDALLSMHPPRDYETWKNIAIAYKAAGGDLDTFLSWSSRDPEKYDEATARRLFEHVTADGKIKAATLFWYARQNGWAGGFGSNATSNPSQKSEEPKHADLEPHEQIIAMLLALFEPGEQVNLTIRGKWSDKREKWEPGDGGKCYERDALVDAFRKGEVKQIMEGFVQEAGAWICQNPTDGTGRGKDKTTAYRHALIESDDIPIDDQIRIMRELDLPITTLTMSGGKSVHALVRVDADGPNHYDERVQMLHEICNAAGLKVDPANRDSSRLTRLAGVRRGDARQKLLFTKIGAKDFWTWLDAHRAKPEEPEDGEDDPMRKFEELFEPMPSVRQELPPILIENTFRKEAIMLIGAAPKVGKTFLAAQMIVAFAMGIAVLGFLFAKCERILVINSEMSHAEYVNRIIDAAKTPDIAAEVAKHVRIAHTDAKPELTVKEVSEIVCGSGYKPDVVIVDPIYPLFDGDENSNEDAKKTLGWLKQIASITGAGVIYMHHFSKGPQDLKEARDRVSGAGTLGRNYAAMWSLTELAPSEEDMAEFPDGTVAVRVSTDLRSFKKSKANNNLDFNAVRINGMFLRDEDGKFDKAPTREAARRAEASKKTAQKEQRMEKVRKKIKQLLDENGGEPVEYQTVLNRTGHSANTIRDYLFEMDEYQTVKMKVDGKGQKKKHVAWTTWQAPLDAELENEEDGDE